MFKCAECGHIFEDGEQRTYAEHHPYGDTTADEYFSVCPVCGGEYEEAKSCERCGGAFLEDELISGYYCKECLRVALNAETFLDFATTGVDSQTDIGTLEDFIFIKVFGLPKSPEISTPSLKAWCRIIYEELDKSVLTTAIFSYMDALSSLWVDFAEYLHNKEVRK